MDLREFLGGFLFSFVQNAPNCQGGIEEKNVSELFGQTAHFPPVGSGRKKVSDSLDQNGSFCPVGTEGRIFQNLSFKTGKTLQWLLERENFRKPSALTLCRGYQLRDRNFLQKSLVKTVSYGRWKVRRDFFSKKTDHLDVSPPVGIEDRMKPSGKDDYRYVRKAATGIKRTRCFLPLEI